MGLDLVTVSEYKQYAGINSTTQDSQIQKIIKGASGLVKQLCRRTFVDYVDETKTDIFSGTTSTLLPSETPVLQVQSVEYSSNYGLSYTTLQEFQDWVYVVNDEAVMLIATPEYLNVVNKPNAFKLTYTAGYETLPEDLKLGVFDLITYYLRNDSAVHSNKAIGSNTAQIEYITSANLPAHIKRVLDQHTANYY